MSVSRSILTGYAGYWQSALATGGIPKRKVNNVNIAMLRLENLAIMKIIVFALGFASVLLSVFSLLGMFNTLHISMKSINLGVVISGLLFGIGFGT